MLVYAARPLVVVAELTVRCVGVRGGVPAAKMVGQRTTGSTATCADAVELRMTEQRAGMPTSASVPSVLELMSATLTCASRPRLARVFVDTMRLDMMRRDHPRLQARHTRELAEHRIGQTERDARMSRCVFCDRESKSREHVIPRWLGQPLKDSRPLPSGMRRIGLTHLYTPPAGRENEAREWSTHGPDLVTTGVCGGCNSGWLAELESRVKPLLGGIVLGRATDLIGDDQIALARWCYKTALLMQLVRAGASFNIIPRERYAQLYSERRPPTDVRMWLGVVVSDGPVVHDAITAVRLSTLRSTLPGYLSALVVGNLLVVCSGRCREFSEPLLFNARADGSTLVQVWPASVQTARWPPADVVADLKLETIAALI